LVERERGPPLDSHWTAKLKLESVVSDADAEMAALDGP
jgi:hypothetical protein